MKLNGWQRLWAVVVLVWGLPVLVVTYFAWPTQATNGEIRGRVNDVSDGEIRAQLNPAENAILRTRPI